MSLPEPVEIWLTSVNPSSPNFAPKCPIPDDFSVGDILWQIANTMHDYTYRQADVAFC